MTDRTKFTFETVAVAFFGTVIVGVFAFVLGLLSSGYLQFGLYAIGLVLVLLPTSIMVFTLFLSLRPTPAEMPVKRRFRLR